MLNQISTRVTFLLLCLAGAGQGREQGPPRPDLGVSRAADGGSAEVEITGTLKTPMRVQKLIAFVGTGPCDPKKGSRDALRSVAIDQNVSPNFFLEIFVPQGSRGHVCGAGYDKEGKMVLFGAYAGNPLTFRGKGEVTFSQVTIALEPVSKQPGSGKTGTH